MFRSDGSMAVVDFGVSQWEGPDLSLTPTGAIIGTPYCMSLEQTAGATIDHRADLYAAGVIFYQMLTGSVRLRREICPHCCLLSIAIPFRLYRWNCRYISELSIACWRRSPKSDIRVPMN